MKALSLWQPWATLIASGQKRVETRGWACHHRGPLLIHAAKTWTGDTAGLCLTEPFRTSLRAAGHSIPVSPHNWTTADLRERKQGWGMPFGAIVGRVDVVDCFPSADIIVWRPDQSVQFGSGRLLQLSETEHAFGDYSPGRYGFLLANPVRFPTPIPLAGKQGLFDVPDHLVAHACGEPTAGPVAPAEVARSA